MPLSTAVSKCYRAPLVYDGTPRVYLSGLAAKKDLDYLDLLRRSGCKHRCFSYCWIAPPDRGGFYHNTQLAEQYQQSIDAGASVMMDSSAYSFHNWVYKLTGSHQVWHKQSRAKLTNVEDYRHEFLEHYIVFCEQYGHLWDFYVTFDYVRTPSVVWDMQQYLEGRGLRPMPIYHGAGDIAGLERFIDAGHKYIGISGQEERKNAKRLMFYYDAVFNLAAKRGVYFHGFGVTSPSQLFRYPWYSVDSSTWARWAGYGKIALPDVEFNILSEQRVTEYASYGRDNRLPRLRRDSTTMDSVREVVAKFGFDLDTLATDLEERLVYNAYIFSHLAELGFGDSRSIGWKPLL